MLAKLKKYTLKFLFLLFLVSSAGLTAQNNKETINLSTLKKSGLINKSFKNVSPIGGCIATYDLVIPKIKKGVINEGYINNWVSGYETFPKPLLTKSSFQKIL